MKTCSQCKGNMKATTVDDSIKVGGRSFTKKLQGFECTKCGDVVIPASELQRFELLAAATIANDGKVSGETFRFMRKALGLAALELAELLNVSPGTLSRWENDEREVPRSEWTTLGRLVIDAVEGRTTTTDILRNAASKTRPAKVVDLDKVAAG